MKYNKKTLDATQLEYLAKAEKLQAELVAQGFMASRIEKEEDRCTFNVIYFDGTHDYSIRRYYNDEVQVSRVDYIPYDNLSSLKRNEIYNKYRCGNIKVITTKKLQAKIDAEKAYYMELEVEEKKATDKTNDFLESIKGMDFVFSYKDYQDKKSPIVSGYFLHNGLEFSFKIHQDGYISKKIEKHYSVDDSIDNFIKLSDNRY